MSEIAIETLTAADEPALRGIALLEITAWGARPDPAQLEARRQRLVCELGQLNPASMGILVAMEATTVLGVCRVAQTREDPKEWMLFGLAIHPDRRRQGLGRAIVQESIRFARCHGARTIRSETHADNQASIAFHRALGFLEEGSFIASADGDEKVAFSTVVADSAGA